MVWGTYLEKNCSNGNLLFFVGAGQSLFGRCPNALKDFLRGASLIHLILAPKLVVRAQETRCHPIVSSLGSLPDRELLALLRGWINCAKLRTINNLAEGRARDRRRRGAFVPSSWKRGAMVKHVMLRNDMEGWNGSGGVLPQRSPKEGFGEEGGKIQSTHMASGSWNPLEHMHLMLVAWGLFVQPI